MRCAGPLAGQRVAPEPEPVSNRFDLTDAPQAEALLTADGPEPRHFSLRQPMSALVAAAMARGQLYVDRSDKLRLDDFATDLALLVPINGRTWRVADEQPFAAEEALLLQHLRTLRGVVVDVGAGPVRYVRELARDHAIPVTDTPFEHYRNADAVDAAAALRANVADSFRLDEVQSVGPGTSNQWFLRATRL